MFDKNDTISYFKNKAKDYDLVENQTYWKFSDQLLWHTLSTYVLENLPREFVFFEAGAGTARWTDKILEAYPASSGVAFDLSPDMLAVAKDKLKKYNNRIKCINGDLHDLSGIDGKFDLIFNFHNVLGFVDNPRIVLNQLANHIKPNGYVVSFVPNLYHMLYFNVSQNNIKDLDDYYLSNIGRFTDDMPKIHFFTPETISKLYRELGIEVLFVTGFPSIIYPGVQETRIEGSTPRIIDVLSDKQNYSKLIELEKKLIQNQEIASRGNNIFVVGKKYE